MVLAKSLLRSAALSKPRAWSSSTRTVVALEKPALHKATVRAYSTRTTVVRFDCAAGETQTAACADLRSPSGNS
jgi:hypothetical protein